MFWDRVVSVQPDGEEEVYDLTVPGPACYGRGGEEPAVTDANVFLGYIPEGAWNEPIDSKGNIQVAATGGGA